MWGLRLLLFLGCVGATTVAAATARWDARLICGNHSWIMQLDRQPIWRTPVPPDYEAFRQHFAESNDFPVSKGSCIIRADYDRFEVGSTAIAYCWPICFVCGVSYLAIRGPRRDLLLHCALWVSASTSLAVVSSVILWCVFGGWGPRFRP